ncbi:MAG: hypothetical protein LH478_04980 [Chitinophagaceae bacterium]|nr:hypothetical protein [Chitinophagaceae bacterium]
MSATKQQLDDLKNIKQMMERSSRFISLSGLSGIAAGICALVGAYFAYGIISPNRIDDVEKTKDIYEPSAPETLVGFMGSSLFMIALVTFVAAFVLAFTFTWLRSRKNNVPISGVASRRLMWSVCVPMVAGGIYLLKLIEHGTYGLIAPGCLVFYGLTLLNASKYTLAEIKYLGYIQLLLGITSCWFIGYGLYFWAAGFGLMHIIYGTVMWAKYERNS